MLQLHRTANERSSHRYATSDVSISLGWWERGAARESAALLLNVGEGGALLLAHQPPPLHQAIRVRLEQTDRSDWLDARVVRLRGLHEVAVAFRDVRPEGLLALTSRDGRGGRGTG